MFIFDNVYFHTKVIHVKIKYTFVTKSFRLDFRRPFRLVDTGLKENIGVCFAAGIFTEDWLYSFPWAPTTATVCCFNLFEIWWTHTWTLSTKECLAFPPFCFYYLSMRIFLFQSTTKNAVKDINQNFRNNKMNEKKSELHFVKKLICQHLTP